MSTERLTPTTASRRPAPFQIIQANAQFVSVGDQLATLAYDAERFAVLRTAGTEDGTGTSKSTSGQYQDAPLVGCFSPFKLCAARQPRTAAELSVPLRNVIAVSRDRRTVVVRLLANKGGRTRLVKVEGLLGEHTREGAVDAWVQAVKEAAGVVTGRKFKVLVNPIGGSGKGKEQWKNIAQPILEAAGSVLDVTVLEHNKHAEKIAEEMSLDFDAVLCVSGDGCIHEVFNGFARRKDARKALRLPICPIPTGSGNALSISILGLEDGFNVPFACLNSLKGKPMALDLFSLSQSGKRTITFLSQATGLMSELDLGTENMRWMGDTRFVVGYLRALIKNAPTACELRVKVVEDKKETMVETLRETLRHPPPPAPVDAGEVAEEDEGLPPLKYGTQPGEDWLLVKDDISYIYAGHVPWVGRDLKQFPVALPNDGLIDVAVQLNVSRLAKLKAMDGAEQGLMFHDDSLKYYKAEAYHLTPVDKSAYISIDGERFPLEPYMVEVHPGLGRVLSPYGTWKSEF